MGCREFGWPAVVALVGVFFSHNIAHAQVTYLHQSDFDDGTYQIRHSGTYVLAEDISFNPHPVGSLADDGVTVLDAYTAGLPFFSQFGDPDDGKYDPAAFGIGFFAAITVSVPDVTIDLNGHTIEQHAEHALLQRFFAVIELADQPFIPGQGPSDFGEGLEAAENVVIKNGTIGRSSHHGIHGNMNRNVTIRNVDFVDYEVAAVALNGVRGLLVKNSTADNRDDVPIIGTFSNARFISAYVDWLVATHSPTTLTIQGVVHTPADIQAALRAAVNNTFEDVIQDGLGFIDPAEHPHEYGLFHNKFGVVDGNSYSFLVNPLGVAVNGFPFQAPQDMRAKRVRLRNVHILSQRAAITEVVAINQGGKAAIDPIGAIFQVRNIHPDTSAPLTVSSLDETVGVYTGNAVANAQALVAKAAHNNEFPSFLDVTRLNITPAVVNWVESGLPLNTLVQGPSDYLCNGDTMFHVNKGLVGFKMDGARHVRLINTSAANLENLGGVGSADCGNYTISHPGATLEGYGGAPVRGYTFSGSSVVKVVDSHAIGLKSLMGAAIGFDVLTDSRSVLFYDVSVDDVEAGLNFYANGGPNAPPDAIGFHIGPLASRVWLYDYHVRNMTAYNQTIDVQDESGSACY